MMTMKTRTWMVQTLVGLIVVACAGLAEAGVIYPVDQTTGLPDTASPVTVSVVNRFGDTSDFGEDVTDTWLPSWEPNATKRVYVAFNFQGTPVTPTAISLKQDVLLPAALDGLKNPFVKAPVGVTPLVLSTSRYPGRCTNYGARAPLAADEPLDYELAQSATTITVNGVARQTFALTSLDCGGIAVINVTVNGQSYLVTVPQDSNLNGIPDIWENQFCPNNACPVGNEDNDTGPLSGTPIGDGIGAFDEFRGFIVSNVHVSTDPRQRDLFAHLVNPQCGPAGFFGGGPKTYPLTGGLFDNLASLVPGSQVHLIGYSAGQANATTDEWVDRFSSYSAQTGFQYVDANGTATTIAPADDRRINANAVFPLGIPNPVVGGTAIKKGLRLTECVAPPPPTSPFGATGLGSTDGPDNSVVFTQRIVTYINGLIDAGAGRKVRLLVFQNNAWVSTYEGAGAPTDADRDAVLSQAMKFYVAHELTHSTRLTPTIEGTRQTSYGYHHAPGTGSVMDQAITQKIDKSASGFNSFYIPSVYNGSDLGSYKIID
jgi:hypothetical protein